MIQGATPCVLSVSGGSEGDGQWGAHGAAGAWEGTTSDHLEIASDPVAMADMLNALDPANPVRVPCVPVLPFTGPVGWVPSC